MATKLRFWLATNMVGSTSETTIELDDEDWSELSEAEQFDLVHELFFDVAMDRLGEWGWEPCK